METLEKGHVDDFTKILEVFPYGDEAAQKAISGVMDEVTKKASLTIQNHTVGSFTDNAYLLLGKAQYFKRDYYAALEPFQYINSHPKYKDQGLKPISTCWIAKCYIGLKKEGEGEAIMGLLLNDIDPIQLQGKLAKEKDKVIKVDNEDKAEIYASAADIAIKQSNYSKAIEKLLVAGKYTTSKSHRIRYTFILGQLYQLQGKNKEANMNFKRILRMIAPYNFEFNASINLSHSYDSTDKSAVRKVRRALKRMIDDDKNDGMYDQIYYELGNLEYKEKNIPAAVKNYKLSVAKSTKNQNQKGLSFLALANIYLLQPEYRLAQAYYDSAARSFKPDYKDYEKIMAKKTVLSELISNLIVIETEDSLQHLSVLSKDQLEKKIDEWIKSAKQTSEQKAKADQLQKEIDKSNAANQSLNPGGPPPLAFGGDGVAQWYFYNAQIITSGAQDFFSTRKWGQRANTDYWRIAAKEKEMLTEQAGADTSKQKTDSTAYGKKEDGEEESKEDVKNSVSTERKNWIANVPFTNAEIESSNKKILEAYYNIGLVYDEKLNDQRESVNNFQEMLKRFPGNKYEPEILYRMYKIYAKHKLTMPKAEEYKQQLIAKYPESPYALILQNKIVNRTSDNDPNREVSKLYGQMYDAYLDGKFEEVKSLKLQAQKKFPGNMIQPKFDLLMALTIGKTETVENFKSSLTAITKDYPKTDVAERAQDILDLLKKQKTALLPDSIKKELEPDFVIEQTGAHYYIFALKNDKADMTDYNMKLNQFCEEYHQFDNLRTNPMLTNEGYQVVVVKEFPDYQKALTFIKDIDMLEFIKKQMKPDSPFIHFVISINNFRKIIKENKFEAYNEFFKKQYSPPPPKKTTQSPQSPE